MAACDSSGGTSSAPSSFAGVLARWRAARAAADEASARADAAADAIDYMMPPHEDLRCAEHEAMNRAIKAASAAAFAPDADPAEVNARIVAQAQADPLLIAMRRRWNDMMATYNEARKAAGIDLLEEAFEKAAMEAHDALLALEGATPSSPAELRAKVEILGRMVPAWRFPALKHLLADIAALEADAPPAR